jgi:CxxC-x17-CxxC domain-containing protein
MPRIDAACKKQFSAQPIYKELRELMYEKEMHKAVCADCGKECEVPFKPDGSRPVYCRECYAKRRPPRRY